MFQLSLIDHIRLSFGSVATSYRAHARAAERLTSRAWQAKVVVMVLFAVATGAALLALTGQRQFQIAAAALAATAVLAFAIANAMSFEPRAATETATRSPVNPGSSTCSLASRQACTRPCQRTASSLPTRLSTMRASATSTLSPPRSRWSPTAVRSNVSAPSAPPHRGGARRR